MRSYISYPIFYLLIILLSILSADADVATHFNFDEAISDPFCSIVDDDDYYDWDQTGDAALYHDYDNMTPACLFMFDIMVMNKEYYYHASQWGDSKLFSATREQELITKIEKTYFVTDIHKEAAKFFYFPYFVTSPNFAKMFLHYGMDIFIHTRGGCTPLIVAVHQYYQPPSEEEVPAEYLRMYPELEGSEFFFYYGRSTSPNHAIALAKLYLALGIDIHAICNEYDGRDAINALTESFIEYAEYYFEIQDEKFHHELPPADPNIPDYYEIKPKTGEYLGGSYRKSKVTRFLENFIESGYPAAMLDTHLMLYPRFMKNASVEDIADILSNPEAYKISVNKNCPYRGAAIETGFEPDPYSEATCPLIPFIHMRDAMGRTPLHIARMTGNDAVYDYLIAQGADITIKDASDNLAASMDSNFFKTHDERIAILVEKYSQAVADVALSPAMQAQLPEFKQAITKIELGRDTIIDDALETLVPLYNELEQHDKLDILPIITNDKVGFHRILQEDRNKPKQEAKQDDG